MEYFAVYINTLPNRFFKVQMKETSLTEHFIDIKATGEVILDLKIV